MRRAHINTSVLLAFFLAALVNWGYGANGPFAGCDEKYLLREIREDLQLSSEFGTKDYSVDIACLMRRFPRGMKLEALLNQLSMGPYARKHIDIRSTENKPKMVVINYYCRYQEDRVESVEVYFVLDDRDAVDQLGYGAGSYPYQEPTEKH
jgi:hypothetical protein